MVHKDAIGRPIDVRFYLGGFNDNVTCCGIYRQRSFFGIKYFTKVYWEASGYDLHTVSKWLQSDWDKFKYKTIDEYNRTKILYDIVSHKIIKQNGNNI